MTKRFDRQQLFGDLLLSVNAAVTATGTSAATGTALTKTLNVVTGGTVTSADGVVLPPAEAGKVCIIAAEYGAALAVWPATGDQINDVSVDGEASQADNTVAIYIAKDGTTWYKLEA